MQADAVLTPMAPRLIVTLLQRLLGLCRHWAGRSLRCLLHLYSVLSRHRIAGARPPDVDDGEKQHSEKPNSADSSYEEARSKPDTLIERPVFLACSSLPSTPPIARTHHHGTMDSFISTLSATSTLHDSPGSSTDDGQYCFPTGLSILAQATCQPQGAFTAEPAKLVASPVKRITSTFPSFAPRFYRVIPIESKPGPWEFGPLETSSIYEDTDVSPWTRYVHPEGQLYFCYNSRQFRFLTEEDLHDDALLAEIDSFAAAIERKADDFGKLPTNVEVVLELTESYWKYYMADLDERRIFWLDETVIDDFVVSANFGVGKKEHLRHIMDFEFWQHIEYFPSHRQMMDGVLEELMGILIQNHIDVITSNTSVAPYDKEELQELTGSVKHLQLLHEAKQATRYVVFASARLMAIFANERFYNFSGFDGARIQMNQSVRGRKETKRSLLIRSLSPLLFYSPEAYFSELERLWVDEVIRYRPWKLFKSRLEGDWEGFVLYSTVLLNANVAFLSASNVQSSNSGPLWQSPAAVASQVSIIASLGSIIVGLLLVRQLRLVKDSAPDATAFLESRSLARFGIEKMAILYSLPYGLLMWGMVIFLTAVAIACFYNVDGDANPVTRSIYAIAWVSITVLIGWTVLTGWKTASFASWRSLLPFWSRRKTSEDEQSATELDDSDARSIRSSRSRMTASTVTQRSWRSRFRKIAEVPRRRLTGLKAWNSFSVDRSNSTLPCLEDGRP